ncbi:hypothetical protein ZWY2020_029914 [Hordeum vulgare]|nr:hypothetical protein ZWY2020_029914 [Hordeum vulgare]
MSLRRLLPRSLSGRLRRSLSTAVAVPGRSLPTADLSARLRRSLSTSSAAATHPPWAIIHDTSEVDRSSSAPGARFRPVDPPGISHIFAPAHLIDPTERPTAGSSDVLRYLGGNLVQLLFGSVGAASDDGHLLLSYHDLRAEGPCTPGTWPGAPKRAFALHHMGLLTQADGGLGCGPPDRFAVAEFVHNGAAVVRFLSEEGKWKVVRPIHGNPSLLRPMGMNQETVAFGGRLWWVDLTLGAVSVDPFADRPEIRFVELPSGSVLPAPAPVDETDPSKVGERTQLILDVANRRRIGVCEGRLRYAEVSPREPFLLSSYALDDEEGSGWKLEQQVALRQVLADGGYPWQENSGQAGPQIAVLDPLNASAIYLKVGEGVLVVDIHNGKVIGAATPLEDEYFSLVPCVLPPWLGSSRIPTAGSSK